MARIFSTLIDYMEAENWRYEIIEGETVLRFHVKMHSGRLLCYAEVQEEKDWLLFYSYLPINVPDDKLTDAAEFLCRANRGMRIGNFELDYDDGEVRYKTSIDVEGGELAPKMIDNLLQANLSTTDRYFNGLMKLVYGERLPVELIEEIERPGSAVDALELEALDDEDEFDDDEFDSEFDDEEDETAAYDDDDDEFFYKRMD